MAYTYVNYKTKKALKEAVASGKRVGVKPGLHPSNGKIVIEGPQYPDPHRWYAECEVVDGVIVKVIS